MKKAEQVASIVGYTFAALVELAALGGVITGLVRWSTDGFVIYWISLLVLLMWPMAVASLVVDDRRRIG